MVETWPRTLSARITKFPGGIMRAQHTFFAFSLLLAACGGDDGTGPEPPENLTGELAYVSDGTIVVQDLADGGMRRIALNTEGLGPVNGLTWQPDGSALVYAPFNFERGWYELHRVPLDGSPEEVLYPSEGHEAYPAFGSDGRLAYWVNGVEVVGEHHAYEIFVDGQPFSHSIYVEPGRAAWSPDGSAVTIAGWFDGIEGLIQVTVATGAQVVLIQAVENERLLNPVYSRSGERVAYTKLIFGPNLSETDEIWVVNADGSNPQRLVTGHSDDMATWSPDDAWIAFTRTEPPAASICIVSASGGPVATLVKGAIVADWR